MLTAERTALESCHWAVSILHPTELPCAEHQDDEKFENTLRAAVSLLLDTKFPYCSIQSFLTARYKVSLLLDTKLQDAEQSSFRERLLVRLLPTSNHNGTSHVGCLEGFSNSNRPAVGNEDLGYGVSAALHFNTQCSITKKNGKDQNIF